MSVEEQTKLHGESSFSELLQLAPKDALSKVYSEIQAFLIADMRTNFALDDNRIRYLTQLMDTTCLGGKCSRGLAIIEISSTLCPGDGSTLHAACVCGWAIEFIQSHFLIMDDIMDSSTTRRGKPCWYKHDGVTTQCAINDGLIVQAWVYNFLNHFLGNHSSLFEIIKLFQRTTLQTTIGQLYDVTSMFDSSKLDANKKPPTIVDFSEFTVAQYKRIVKYKTAYYSFFLPVMCGLILADSVSTVDSNIVERITLTMGEYFQVQDDFIDCFGDPVVTGKIGTDIEDVKCSWLAVTFLEVATSEQKDTFKNNYGQHDAAKVAIIKRLYEDVGILKKFAEYEDAVTNAVEEDIAALQKQSAAFASIISSLWSRTFKRVK